MKARALRILNDLRESYWFVPTLMSLAAVLLALAMIWLDSHQATRWMDRIPWLYAARPECARSLLSSIGGSMIGVAGTTFSVTIAAVVYASGQYGPRLLTNFMSDRGNQVTLGTFIATFLYSLIVVRTVRSPGEAAGEVAFVPQLALLVGVLLVLCSIAVLIYFIHHVPSRIHINDVIERIGHRLLREIDRRFPDGIGQPLARADHPQKDRLCDDPASDPATAICANGTGYIQLIDDDSLIAAARQHDLVLRLARQPGDFVRRGSVLLHAAASPDDDARDALRRAFAIGSRRTALQDLRFLIDELVEIAARALSPGVNDPFTANTCLDWLGAALAELAARELPSPLRADDGGKVRVVAEPITFGGFVDRGFGALVQYVAVDMNAALRFLAVIDDVGSACAMASRRHALHGQAAALRDLAEGALSGVNRDAVLEQADRLLAKLAEPR